MQDAVAYNRELHESKIQNILPDIRYYINENHMPAFYETFMRIEEIVPLSLVKRINKDFDKSFKRRIQIRWPIETSIYCWPPPPSDHSISG